MIDELTTTIRLGPFSPDEWTWQTVAGGIPTRRITTLLDVQCSDPDLEHGTPEMEATKSRFLRGISGMTLTVVVPAFDSYTLPGEVVAW
jgi:hypothetical protein